MTRSLPLPAGFESKVGAKRTRVCDRKLNDWYPERGVEPLSVGRS